MRRTHGLPWRRSEEPNAQPGSRPPQLVESEDDLPPPDDSVATTTIPPYEPVGGSSGYSLASEPLPSVRPRPVDNDRLRIAGRRGTQHLGLLVLRVGVGTVLVAHGLQKAFGWWSGQGLRGFETSLTDLGYRHADILTYLAAGVQIAAGALLVLGLFTPLAAAGALAYLVNGLLAHVAAQRRGGNATFFLPDGNEYTVVLIVAVAAIILAGPGLYGCDAGRGWARRPFIGSFAALLLGFGGGIAVWVLFNGANPLIT